MSDEVIAAIVNEARKRHPDATSISVQPPQYYWSAVGGEEISAASIELLKDGCDLFHEAADDLPGLLDKLKQLKGAEDATP